MNCLAKSGDSGVELLLDYVSGGLGGSKVSEVERHAASCASCRELIAAQRKVWLALEDFSAPEISRNFDARLHATITAGQARSPIARWFANMADGFSWKPLAAGALACGVLVIGLLIRLPFGNEQAAVPDDSKQSRIERIDVHQLEEAEQTLEDLEMLSPAVM